MRRYVARRLALTIPVIFAVTVLVFLMLAVVPGDPALAILGPYANADALARLRAQMGLDRPLVDQYVIWLGRILGGDFGHAYSVDRPVIDEVLDRLGPTVLLAAVALAISVVCGIAAGLIAAVRQFTATDRFLTAAVLLCISVPPFWLAMMLILLFAVAIGWFPVSGMYAAYGGGDLGDVLRHLMLPAVALAAVPTGLIGRLTRAFALDVLRQEHVRGARAGGLREYTVLRDNVLRNTLVPLLPVLALQAGFLLGGSAYVETVFQWPGIGWMLVQAIAARDILLVQGGVLVVAAVYVLINLAADVGQRLLDPRVRQ